ncbi:hypothetical protein JYU34_004711 [Plutella xylostella]|uniref:Secreted protein n=1 Tax=Plutella xylostella TaxID=51655 RepID=A0ABQ7QYN9_PLUXY|nr:hypothetical protein JYU34_004711 [Plutella xylostella]
MVDIVPAIVVILAPRRYMLVRACNQPRPAVLTTNRETEGADTLADAAKAERQRRPRAIWHERRVRAASANVSAPSD